MSDDKPKFVSIRVRTSRNCYCNGWRYNAGDVFDFDQPADQKLPKHFVEIDETNSLRGGPVSPLTTAEADKAQEDAAALRNLENVESPPADVDPNTIMPQGFNPAESAKSDEAIAQEAAEAAARANAAGASALD